MSAGVYTASGSKLPRCASSGSSSVSLHRFVGAGRTSANSLKLGLESADAGGGVRACRANSSCLWCRAPLQEKYTASTTTNQQDAARRTRGRTGRPSGASAARSSSPLSWRPGAPAAEQPVRVCERGAARCTQEPGGSEKLLVECTLACFPCQTRIAQVEVAGTLHHELRPKQRQQQPRTLITETGRKWRAVSMSRPLQRAGGRQTGTRSRKPADSFCMLQHTCGCN